MRYLLLLIIAMNAMVASARAEDGVLAYGENKQGEKFSVSRWMKKGIVIQAEGNLLNLYPNAHEEEITEFTFSYDGSLLASLSSQSLKVWKLGSKKEFLNQKYWDVTSIDLSVQIQGVFREKDKIVFLPGSRIAVYGLRKNMLHTMIFNLKTGKELKE